MAFPRKKERAVNTKLFADIRGYPPKNKIVWDHEEEIRVDRRARIQGNPGRSSGLRGPHRGFHEENIEDGWNSERPRRDLHRGPVSQEGARKEEAKVLRIRVSRMCDPVVRMFSWFLDAKFRDVSPTVFVHDIPRGASDLSSTHPFLGLNVKTSPRSMLDLRVSHRIGPLPVIHEDRIFRNSSRSCIAFPSRRRCKSRVKT